MATEVAKPVKSRIAPLAYGRRPPAKETTATFEMTPARKGLLRLGLSLFAFGLASLILPLFGLQFGKLQPLGDNAWIAGVGLMGFGALVSIASILRFRLRSLVLIAGGVVAVIVLLVLALAALGWMLQSRRRPSYATPAAAPPPGWNAPRPPPSLGPKI
jgi:hypothetical protein